MIELKMATSKIGENTTILSEDAAHILLVDDDTRIRTLLAKYLREHGYRITASGTADSAEKCMKGLMFDLIVLDVMMPGESGTSFARRLKTTSNIPILMLTARADAEDRVNGLEIGVDDYMGKPFEPRELLLRIGNILKNRQPNGNSNEPKFVQLGDLTFNVTSGQLKRGEELIHLTEREREILQIFVEKPGETVSRIDLADAGIAGSERAVDVQINRLRRKIEDDPANPYLLQTVRGIGYRLMA